MGKETWTRRVDDGGRPCGACRPRIVRKVDMGREVNYEEWRGRERERERVVYIYDRSDARGCQSRNQGPVLLSV